MWMNMPETSEQGQAVEASKRVSVAGVVRRGSRVAVAMVPVAAIRPNAEQPRKHFSEDRLAELAASIRTHGMLQPIVVRKLDEGYEIIAGERRYRAAVMAGAGDVPVLVRETDDPLELALIENLQREDLSPLEEAEALAGLIERHGYSHRTVADLLGKSRPYVSNTLALNRLPDAVKSDLHREGHTIPRELLMGVARQESPTAAMALWKRLRLDVMSVRQFREAGGHPASGRRPGVREVMLAARRLNRALRRLQAEAVARTPEVARLERVLRRTCRLIERSLVKPPGDSTTTGNA